MLLFPVVLICVYASASLALTAQFDFSNAAELKVINSNGESRDRFGGSVSLSKDFVVVGSADASPDGIASGMAYVFTNISRNSSNIPQELIPVGKTPREGFGSSTAIFHKTIAVGAPKYDLFSGAIYIFRYSDAEWSQTQIIQASDKSRGDFYGVSLALSDKFLVVGANSKDEFKGSVYVLADTSIGFIEKIILQPSDSHEYQKFGHAVAISDNFIAVGAVGDDTKGTFSHGAVYLYEWVTSLTESGSKQYNWTKLAKLYANTPKGLSNFGQSVAISRHISSLNDPFLYTLIIGCENDEVLGIIGAGAVYVFLVKSGSITQVARLTASDPSEDAFFGYSISVHSGHFLIGAPGYTSPKVGPESGAVYLFEASGSGSRWTQVFKFIANDTVPYGRFGISTSIYEGDALIGADQANGASPNSGAVYLYSPKFADLPKKKAQMFWSQNPEEDILVLLTILPFAVLLIPVLVFSCVYGLNSKWVYIENAIHYFISRCKAEEDLDTSARSTRGLISGDSSDGYIDGDRQVELCRIIMSYCLSNCIKCHLCREVRQC